MKKNTNVKYSLKAKITIMLIAISMISVIFTGISSYFISNNVIKNKLEKTSTQTIQEIARGIDNYLGGLSSLVETLATDTNVKNADNTVYMNNAKSLIGNVKATDESILNVFLGTERGLFYADPYAELPADFDHKTRDWYIEAIKNPEQIIITEPYLDTGSNTSVISIVSAIQDNSTTVGVIGMDISLAALSDSLLEIVIGDSGYIYMIDQNGILITHRDNSLIGTDTVTQLSIWSEVSGQESGFASYVYEGQDKFSAYVSSELTGWKIMAAMDYAELTKDTSVIRNYIFAIIIIVGMLSIIVAFLFSGPISKNIRLLLSGFESLSQGDLTTYMHIKSKDEFNTLGIQFNHMVDNISKTLQSVHEASSTVLDTSVILSNVAEETNASINEVARAVEEIAHGATEQAESSSAGAASVVELSEKLDVIEGSTNLMSELSQNTENITVEGLKSVKTLIENSDSTMESTSKVSELIVETHESVRQIDEISNTIDAITAQTNLLALNASIEAARAGESGKGFAVVADEIRQLAEQSKESTVKIKAIVQDISEKTELSVEAMEKANDKVKEQVSLVGLTQTAFEDITKAVGALFDKVLEIKNWTSEITERKEDIVIQIESISSISEETASTTEEVTASAEQIAVTVDEIAKNASDLHYLSEELQKRLNTFKLK